MKKIILFIVCLLFVGFTPLLAQIGGKVVDSQTKEPIIGASVQVVGTTMGDVTDVNGNFVISTSEKSMEVEITYIGYVSQKLTLTADNNPVIEMKENAKILDEVVVIGYGVQKKSDLTGAVASVKSDDIQKIPTSTLAQALQGQAAGVEVVRSSGAPGSGTSIRIRGVGTINNSEPLYIVDGIPMDGIDFISSDDIASIEILKDAASAAIYGSRAANGVVLITTKTGKESSRPIISAKVYYGSQNVAKGPDVFSKEQFPYYLDYVRNLPTATDPTGANAFPSSPVRPDWALRQSTIDQVNKSVNYWDYIIRSSPMYNANLSVSGGTKDFNYYVSGGIYHDDGIIEESKYNRKNLNVKVNTKIIKNLTLGASIGFTREDKTNIYEGKWGVVQTAINYNPLVPIYSPNGDYTWTTPIEVLRRTTYDSYQNTLVGQISLDWDITKGLKFTTRAGESMLSSDNDKFSRYNQNDQNVLTARTVNIRKEPATTNHFNWDNIFSYIHSFGKHNLNIMAGQSVETAVTNSYTIYGDGYGGYDESLDALNFANYSLSTNGYKEGWSVLSFLGRFTYDYDSKYLLQVNFREDGSSRFAPATRWGAFPSVSLGWKLTGESFMSDVKWISLLKLRAGWGILGNNNIGNFKYLSLVGSPGNYIYGTGFPALQPSYSIKQFGNPNIVWEKTISKGVGLDLNMFNNRFTSSFDLFIKNTNDMLNAVPIPYMTGIRQVSPDTPPMQNVSSAKNTGGEIQAAYQDQIGKFRYSLGGNISYIKNRVTELGGQGNPIWGGYLDAPTPLGYVTRTIVGVPIGAFYGWKTDGLMKPSDFDAQGNALIPTFAAANKFQPGDMKFVDVNKDGIIDSNDQTYLGSPLPDLYYGFNVNLGYKDFDLSFFFQGVAGNKIYNVMKFFKYSSVQYDGNWTTASYSNSASDYFDKVYRPAEPTGTFRDYFGANPNGTVPSPRNNPTIDQLNFSNSDFYIEDGSYLRLKNIQLSYQLPKEICKRTKIINNCRAYITITNLFTVTKYSGLDPEVGSSVGSSGNLFSGIDLGVYPQSRTYMVGASIDF
jgi:TonB-linked SusC/RagA family outer membrane protein